MGGWAARLGALWAKATGTGGGTRPRADAAAHSGGVQRTLAQMPPLVFAVGDVHGRADLYAGLEAQIAQIVGDYARQDGAQQNTAHQGTAALVILLGDVIDRGPASAQVLDHLLAPPPAGISRLVLRGNHEEMFLRFWDNPRLDDPWLRYGGAEMLASYGVDADDGALARRGRLAQVLAACLPSEHVDFLRATPLALHAPGYLFAHAGANPARPLSEQRPADLLWGDPALLDAPAGEGFESGVIVVHGHRPTPDGQAFVGHRRINLDTGAYATGRLTALQITHGRATNLIQQAV